jgi:hypothetical protein
MIWHNRNNEGGTWNFNINMVLQGMDCEDVDWPQVPVDGVHWQFFTYIIISLSIVLLQLLQHESPISGPSLLFSCISLWYVVMYRVAMNC